MNVLQFVGPQGNVGRNVTGASEHNHVDKRHGCNVRVVHDRSRCVQEAAVADFVSGAIQNVLTIVGAELRSDLRRHGLSAVDRSVPRLNDPLPQCWAAELRQALYDGLPYRVDDRSRVRQAHAKGSVLVAIRTSSCHRGGPGQDAHCKY